MLDKFPAVDTWRIEVVEKNIFIAEVRAKLVHT